MTRDEYLEEQVLKLTNDFILPQIRDRENLDKTTILGKIGFLYRCSRINPLELLLILGRLMNDKEFNNIMQIFKDSGFCIFEANYINEERGIK